MSAAAKAVWWVLPHVLGGMPMPFVHPLRRLNLGGSLAAYDDELPALHRAGVRAFVCLLNITADADVFQTAGFHFKCIPLADGHAPTLEQANQFIVFVEHERWQKRPVVVYCEAGLGRTGTMLAAYLVHTGKSAKQAIATVRAVESAAIGTGVQLLFLEQFAKANK